MKINEIEPKNPCCSIDASFVAVALGFMISIFVLGLGLCITVPAQSQKSPSRYRLPDDEPRIQLVKNIVPGETFWASKSCVEVDEFGYLWINTYSKAYPEGNRTHIRINLTKDGAVIYVPNKDLGLLHVGNRHIQYKHLGYIPVLEVKDAD